MKGIRLVMAVAVLLFVLGSGIALAEQEAGETQAASSNSPSQERGSEIPSARTATSETFRLPGGAFETRLYESPINYRNDENKWMPIDEGLEAQGDGTGLTNGANSFDVSLPERLGSAPVRVEIGHQWISARLLGADSDAVELTEGGDTASYEGARAATTFELSALANGVKENIEIANPSAPHAFSFGLEMSQELSPSIGANGSIEIRGNDERLVARLPAPTIADGAGAFSEAAVHYELEQAPGGWTLSVVADPAWLEQSNRVWPVQIDPSIIVPTPSLDCTIRGKAGEAGPTGLCGSSGSQQLQVASWPTGKRARALLRFDLSSIPASAWIESASLSVRAPQSAIKLPGIELRRMSKSWSYFVNWLNSDGSEKWLTGGGDFDPGNSGSILTSKRGSQAGWWNFEGSKTTALVRRWFREGPSANFGAVIKPSNEAACQAEECSVAFASSAATVSENRPKLSVIYTPAAPSSSKVVSPREGTVSPSRLKLQSKWTVAGVTGITFQYNFGTESNGTFGNYVNIPANLVRNAKGEEVKWPMAVTGAFETEALYFDTKSALPEIKETGGDMEIRALFEGVKGVDGYSEAAKVKIDPDRGSPKDAVAQVGPGSLDLLTGNFTVVRTDVSIAGVTSSLEFARTHSSRVVGLAEDTTVLGRGWKPTVPVEAAGGSEWRSVKAVTATAEELEEGLGDYALLTDLEGYEYAFEKSGGSYLAPPEASGWVLAQQGTKFTLSDPEGNVTTFESSGGAEYLPVAISTTGGATNSTRLVYQIVDGNRRLTEIIAASAPGIYCTSNPTTTVGCRTLTFQYKAASTWGAPASYKDRLSSITYFGPTGKSTMGQWEVAKYKYDSSGRLIEEWDPRVGSPCATEEKGCLKETYGYVGSGTETPQGGELKTIAPPGLEPWTLEYSGLPGEAAGVGRLKSVKRASLVASPTVAQTTIRLRSPHNRQRGPL